MKNLLLWLTGINLIRSTATKCGHKIWIFQTDEYCSVCLKKMTIPCAWCGRPIFIDDPITLYRNPGDFSIVEHAVASPAHPSRWVGCMRSDCADSGADRAGVWVPGEGGKGKIFLLSNPVYRLLTEPDITAVIVPDLSDPDAVVIHKNDLSAFRIDSGKIY